jgi:peptidoglycan/LPS O-acetylase OafA/YrhL
LPEVAVTILAFAVSVILAVTSWRFVERPVLRFGYRWRYQEA